MTHSGTFILTLQSLRSHHEQSGETCASSKVISDDSWFEKYRWERTEIFWRNDFVVEVLTYAINVPGCKFFHRRHGSPLSRELPSKVILRFAIFEIVMSLWNFSKGKVISNWWKLNFFKISILNCMYVCTCIYAPECSGALEGQKKVLNPGAIVTGAASLMSAGIWTQILWKSSVEPSLQSRNWILSCWTTLYREVTGWCFSFWEQKGTYAHKCPSFSFHLGV